MKAKYITPAVTAFDANGRLDREANQAVYEYLIAGGMDGIAVMGSTGEFFAMPPAQRRELAELAVETIGGRVRTVVGTCGMCVEETVGLTRHARDIGADAVLLISPYYFALPDESMERYYDAVASAADIDIILYNFPARTGYDLKPSVTLSLLRKHRNIVGYKDTVPSMAHTRSLIGLVRGEFPDFEIYCGYDENFAHTVLSGGSGCVGGLSNFAPELFSAWAAAVNAKDFGRVSEIQRKVDLLSSLAELGPLFIPVVKKAMALRGVPLCDCCTAPIGRVDADCAEEIRDILRKAALI